MVDSPNVYILSVVLKASSFHMPNSVTISLKSLITVRLREGMVRRTTVIVCFDSSPFTIRNWSIA